LLSRFLELCRPKISGCAHFGKSRGVNPMTIQEVGS
jgi:hypothetical protein